MHGSIFQPLVGGLLIGISSSLMLWSLGRITGISGILAESVLTLKSGSQWRWSFLAGLMVSSLILLLIKPDLFSYTLDYPWIKISIAGLLVGFGTRLGSGCTSGHGVCGLARLSKRSLMATVIFMAFGILTVYLTNGIS